MVAQRECAERIGPCSGFLTVVARMTMQEEKGKGTGIKTSWLNRFCKMHLVQSCCQDPGLNRSGDNKSYWLQHYRIFYPLPIFERHGCLLFFYKPSPFTTLGNPFSRLQSRPPVFLATQCAAL